MYDALNIAEYVIDYEHKQNRSISNLRLQKLLYFVQAQFWVTNKRACFNDKLEAWNLGPVVPSVYHKFKLFGSLNFPQSLVTEFRGISTGDQRLINETLDKCAQYSTSTLISLTHGQKPWQDAYARGDDKTIYPDSMRIYFGDTQ